MKAMIEPSDRTGDGPEMLDAFFDAARAEAPLPDGDFMARLTADALAEMPVAGVRVRGRTGLWEQLVPALGGWAGLSGLVAACAVGLWVGVNPPASLGLDDWWNGTGAELGELGVDPLSGFELALMEG
ncbi:hypothetical protein [Sagittula salina]|uniref:Dihydroorotate dehydrogenase n=1 Tax=Sagittula salina TaxID=2820268 RepID=A0A940MLI0_9RHOB|nr:hypothetical protein [Sagittula salina]MBP0484030.1 hypothetical protein [Sagittula salina]